jgi:class 3 adenylate cyclase
MGMDGLNRGPGPRAPDAEVRHATVLKCDIVGSTRVKRGLDLDGQLAFKRGFEATIAEVAARHGGHVEQFEGDGALVFFGYPEAREDAPESAVRMGLEVVEAIDAARFVPDVRLQIRVGIASGPLAVIKEPGVERGEPVVGLIIDMAERLRALADPDRVVTCDRTKRLAARFFEYDDLGIVQVKGFEEGVRAWRVVRKSSVVSRFDAQRYDESRGEIIGRRDALARLAEAWAAARGGQGRAVCLVGEAGIGKSRLARAALDLAAPEGATVLTIDCMPSTGNTPLFPIGVLLRRCAGIAGGASESEKRERATELLARFLAAAEVPDALSYLAPLFGLDAAPIPAGQTPGQVRDQTIALVVRMLRALAAQRPSVLLCEDLHWADDTTASIVERLADEIGDLAVLMIATARPEADNLPDPAKAIPIPLPPLDPETSVDLVRSVARGTALSDDLVRRIVDRCEGVPLLLEEVTRSSVDTVEGAEAVRMDGEAGAVPTPLQLVVESRLGRLPGLELIVQAASVLGREFSVAVLEQMVPAEQSAKVAEALRLCTRHGLFARASGTSERAQFRHVMICEAVHDTLLGRDRKRLHSQAADILRRGYLGTPDAAPDVLAEHLRVAERWVECIQTHLAASGDTAVRGAYVETEGHCEAALKLIDKVASPEQRRELQFRLQVQLGVAWTGKYGYASPQVESAYRKAEAVCGEGAEAEKLYPIMRGLATLNLVRGKLATAHNLSQQGLALAERSNRPEFRIDAMSVQCYTTLYHGRLADCQSWIERCLSLYREERGEGLTYPVPQDAATAALALLPTVAWLRGDAQAAEEAIREGLAHVERLNRDFDRALLHSWIAGTRYTQRRYDEAEAHACKAVAISQAVAVSQQPRYRDWYATGLLMSLLARAAREAAPECIRQATEMCTAFAREGVGLNASYYLWGLARGYARMGDRQTAQYMVAEAFRRAEASEESRMNAELLILEAELEPDDASARRLLARALRIADEEGAIATSLRAAAAMVLRAKGAPADLDTARMAQDLLDGQAPYPAQRDWMHGLLARLRRGIR